MVAVQGALCLLWAAVTTANSQPATASNDGEGTQLYHAYSTVVSISDSFCGITLNVRILTA